MNIISKKLTPLSELIAPPIFPQMKITQVKDRMMAWPPMILANRRTIKAKGFVKMPKNSITGIIGTGTFNHVGTSGQKISFQYSRLPNRLMAKRVQKAKKNVMVILPVTLAPPGKMGSSPKRLLKNIKKKHVIR